MDIGYYRTKIINKLLCRNSEISCEKINDYFRRQGVTIGEKCRIYSNILSSEPYMISIGDCVTISNDVQLLTHDNSIIKIIKNQTDLFGEVRIGNNCFIGAHVIIMGGVTIGNDCIVGAGSVVVKSVPDSTIVAGNPAKAVSSIQKFKIKNESRALNITGLSADEKKCLIMSNRDKWLIR